MRKKIVFAALFLSLVCGGAIGLYGQSGAKKCPDCNGTGRGDVCSVCKGTKILSVFNGFFTMKFPCTYCNGSGRFPCFTCNGTGIVQPPASYQPVPQNDQYTPSGGGGGGSGRIQCSSCGGTGSCSACNGNYASMCRYCNGEGRTKYGYGSNASYETCTVCRGSGKSYCAVCYNPGGYSHNPGKCSVCRGRGYID